MYKVIQHEPRISVTLAYGSQPFQILESDYSQFDDTHIFANDCQLCVTTLKAKRLHIHASSFRVPAKDTTIDTSGAPGEVNQESTNDKQNGGDAYDFYFATPDLIPPYTFHWKASGGDGAAGYSGVKIHAPGGKGGKGGNGGNGWWWVRNRFVSLLHEFEAHQKGPETTAYTEPDDDTWWPRWLSDVKSLEVDALADEETAEMVKKLKMVNLDVRAEELDPGITEALQYLGRNFNAHRGRRGRRTVNGSGGPGGQGAPAGQRGEDGRPGVLTVWDYSADTITLANECIFHPYQVALTMRVAENNYFAGTTESLGVALTTFRDIIVRLGFLDQLQPNDPLFQAYRQKEYTLFVLPSVGSEPASITSMRQSLRQARMYVHQIEEGLDFFGHERNWVPRASRKFYEDQLTKMLQGFQDVERTYKRFQRIASDQSRQSEQIGLAKAAARASMQDASSETKTYEQDLKDTEWRIAAAQESLPRMHHDLNQLIEHVAHKIKNTYKLSIAQWLNAATMFAFAPTGIMAAIQGISLLSDLNTKISDDAGNLVNKSYLVNKIYRVKGDLDSIQEALAVGPGGHLTVDDPGAMKLMGEEEDLRHIIQDYRDILKNTGRQVLQMFDDYVQRVLDRNNLIIHYNVTLALWYQARDKYKASEQALKDLGAENLRAINYELPALALTVERRYFDVVVKVFKTLFNGQKALSFWSLSESGDAAEEFPSLREECGMGFPILNASEDEGEATEMSTALTSARNALLQKYADAFDKFGLQPSTFGEDGVIAIKVLLTSGQLHALKNNELETEFAISFHIEEAYHNTSRAENPFAGFSDVRLSKVRVYLEGARTADGVLSVSLQHMGRERLVDTNNQVHEYFHDALSLTFVYELQSGTIRSDGIIAKSEYDNDSTYALPGPFCLWRIAVSKEQNVNLDLSHVTAGWLEFSGYHRAFDAGLKGQLGENLADAPAEKGSTADFVTAICNGEPIVSEALEALASDNPQTIDAFLQNCPYNIDANDLHSALQSLNAGPTFDIRLAGGIYEFKKPAQLEKYTAVIDSLNGSLWIGNPQGEKMTVNRTIDSEGTIEFDYDGYHYKIKFADLEFDSDGTPKARSFSGTRILTSDPKAVAEAVEGERAEEKDDDWREYLLSKAATAGCWLVTLGGTVFSVVVWGYEKLKARWDARPKNVAKAARKFLEDTKEQFRKDMCKEKNESKIFQDLPLSDYRKAVEQRIYDAVVRVKSNPDAAHAEALGATSKAAVDATTDAIAEFLSPLVWDQLGHYENVIGSKAMESECRKVIKERYKDTLSGLSNDSYVERLCAAAEAKYNLQVSIENAKKQTAEQKNLELAKVQAERSREQSKSALRAFDERVEREGLYGEEVEKQREALEDAITKRIEEAERVEKALVQGQDAAIRAEEQRKADELLEEQKRNDAHDAGKDIFHDGIRPDPRSIHH